MQPRRGWSGRIGKHDAGWPWSQIASLHDSGDAFALYHGGFRFNVVGFAKSSVSDPKTLWKLADRQMTGTYRLVRRPDARIITNTLGSRTA